MSFEQSLLADIPDLAVPEVFHGAPTVDELVRSLRCIDLTTLAGDDTDARVVELCNQALALPADRRVAAVCVYPAFVQTAKQALAGSGIAIATVAAGFPHGLSPLGTRISEVEAARDLGADEIDVVIRRSYALEGEWRSLYHEVSMFKSTSGDALLKVILATGELGRPETVYRAALVAIMAGADFVKTSTGKETVNATPESAAAMIAAVKRWRELKGKTIGFKAAGGIRTAAQAVVYQRIASVVLGDHYVSPATFRLGASSLLGDILGSLPAG